MDPIQAFLQANALVTPLYPSTSRYYGIAAAQLTLPDGTTIAYLRRRFVPPPGTPQRLRYTYWLHYAEGSAMPPLLLKLIFDRIGSGGAVQAVEAAEEEPRAERVQRRADDDRPLDTALAIGLYLVSTATATTASAGTCCIRPRRPKCRTSRSVSPTHRASSSPRRII